MHRAFAGAWLALSLSAPLPIFAASPDSQSITLQQAIEIALARDAGVQQAENTREQSTIGVSEAQSQFLPDLTTHAAGARTTGRTFSEAEGRVVDDSARAVDFGVVSGVTLFNGFRDLAALRKARFDLRSSEHDLQWAEETAVFDVMTAFLTLMQQRDQAAVQQGNLTAEQTLEHQVQQFVRAGALPTSELYQQQTIVASARLAAMEAQRAVELAQIDVMQVLVLDPAGHYEFVAPDPAAFDAEGELPDLDNLLARSDRRRQDIAAQRERVAAARQDMQIARSGHWPTITLSAGYFTGYTSASGVRFDDQLDLRGRSAIGLTFTAPLFDRNVARNASRQASLRERSAALDLEDQRQQVGLQVRRAYVDLQMGREALHIAEDQERMAERAMSASTQRFQAGATTLIELIQARSRYVTAQSARVNARTNLLLRRALLDYYTGDFMPPEQLSAR